MAIIRRNQAVATAGKLTFIFDFLVLNDKDIEVFLTPVGQVPDDDNDRLTLAVNYQVLGVGNDAGGLIELLNIIPVENDIITIQGKRPPQPPANFQPGQFSAEELNNTIDGLSILIEDIQTQICAQMVSYDASNVFNSNLAQNKLPLLEENEIWVGGINSGIVKINVIESVDAAILRAQLADDQPGQDGSQIVGYSNTVFTPNNLTVHDAIARLDTKVIALEQPGASLVLSENIILGGDFSTNPAQEGITFSPLVDTALYVADGWRIDQKGTLRGTTAIQGNIPTISGDGAKVLLLKSIAIEVLVQQLVLGATDQLVFEQLVEGNVYRPIADTEEISMSFWVYSALTGTYTVSLRNEGKDQFVVKEYTVNLANTWQLISLEFPPSPQAGTWNYENGVGLIVGFTLAAGTDLETVVIGTWEVGNEISTANQVNFAAEVPGTAIFFADIELSNKSSLPLPRRTAQQELTLAQRYFEKSYNQGVNPGTITLVGSPSWEDEAGSLNQTGLRTPLVVTKRDTPAIIWYSPATGAKGNVSFGPGGDITVVSNNDEGETSTGWPEVGAGVTINRVNAQFTADSRLT